MPNQRSGKLARAGTSAQTQALEPIQGLGSSFSSGQYLCAMGNTVSLTRPGRCQCEAAGRTINSFRVPSSPQADYPFLSRISSTCDMGDSPSSHFQKLFESALQDYERQTGTKLTEHPLADQLERCKSVESVTAVIVQGQARRAFGGFRRRSDGKVTKSLQRAVSVLYPLSTGAVLDTAIRTVCPRC